MTRNMSAAHLPWIRMLLLLGGVLSSQWSVNYLHQNICAVRGTSVFIPCSFSYPKGETVQSVKWGHERNDIYSGPFIYDSHLKNNTSSKFQYVGDKNHNCSFKILHVQSSDTGKYVFRFRTNSIKGKFTGFKGATLQILDLNIRTTNGNKTVKEGDSMDLTCVYSCDGERSSEITWLKNGTAIHEGRVLHLRDVSSINSGSYVCSLKGHIGTTSGVKLIDVEFGPRNTSVFVTPSEINPGGNVTLTCSSLATPPVKNYTWFHMHKNNITAVADKLEYFIVEVRPRDYGQYFCTASNKHGSQNSSVVTLTVKEVTSTFKKNILILIVFVTTLLSVSILLPIRRFYKKKSKPPETNCEVDTQNPIYMNWMSKDQTHEEQHDELIYASVIIKRKPDMVKKMDSPGDDDDECVIYSTVCSERRVSLS